MGLLGIDVGTTACKVAAFAEEGRLLALASCEYALQTPQPGHLELDPDEVWSAVAGCIRQVNGRLGRDRIEAIAISSQGEAVTPIGPSGEVLAASPVTFDNRAVAQASRLEEAIGRSALARITGQPPHPMFTIAKLMWWRDHDPDLVRRTWKFLCYGDLVGYRLGAEPAIDCSMAARTMAFDIHADRWSPLILAVAGIDEAQLATPVPSGTVIGRLRDDLADDLGFSGRPLIVAGGHDQPCGVLGAGVAAGGRAMLAIGTTICLAPVFAEYRAELLARDYPCYPHVVSGRFISLAGNFTGGSLLRWYRDTFGEAERRVAHETDRDLYDVLIDSASAEPSALLVLPHFAGAGTPHNDPRSQGAILGLTFGATRGQIVRSLLEGVLFEMAVNRACLAEIGVPIAGAVAVGGGARSSRWLQIAADILGIPVRRSTQPEAACWGAALLAGIGAGVLPATTATVGFDPAWGGSEEFFPTPPISEYYQQRLSVYRSVYAALRPINNALSARATGQR